MPPLAKQFNREQIEAALEYIIENEVKLNPSTAHDLVYKGLKFAPKEVVRCAARLVKFKDADNYSLSGGTNTNDPLIKLGFAIVGKNEDFFESIIAEYKAYVRQNGLATEVYKWELVEKHNGRPDVLAADFAKEIKDLQFFNLVYGVGIGVIQHLAKVKAEQYRDCFKFLFDESISIALRVPEFTAKVTALYRTLVPDPAKSSHHDERTIATFLTYHYPQKYSFYKESFYRILCERLGEKIREKGAKYVHYLDIVDEFIGSYIAEDFELIEMVNANKTANSFADEDFKLLAQDILYTILEKQNMTFKNLVDQLSADMQEREIKRLKIITKKIESDKLNQWIKFGDIRDVIKGHLAHYELGVSKKTGIIAIGLHFEDRTNNKRFKQIIGEALPEGFVWKSWYDAESIVLEREFHLNDQNLCQDTLEVLHSFDEKIGPLVREIILNKFADQQYPSLVSSRGGRHPLNQILYGPPGTGKTYHTIDKALSIIEGKAEEVLAAEGRDVLKGRFQTYLKLGQIVFTTFHQSMSYEDFVAGIKPEVEEDKDGQRSVVYEVKDGVFKSLSKRAVDDLVSRPKAFVYGFDDAWNDLLAEFQGHDAKKGDYILDILTPNKGLKVTEVTNNGNLRLTPKSNVGLEYTVSFARAKKLQAAFPDLSIVKNIDKQFRSVIGGANSTAYWAVLNVLNKKLGAVNPEVLEENKSTKPYVLIIDEINRGNVSAIFGELITLIEESKRKGAKEALELTLPYSKELFSVPENLYIIGTMNTADRSVEALDTALRRRFAFKQMLPQANLLSGMMADGIALDEVLDKINQRIEILLDVDHQLGHSYLINVADSFGLAAAFNNCIVPLLQEYFYHDYEKIFLVLGEGFVRPKNMEVEVSSIFPQTANLNIQLPDIRQGFQILTVDEHTVVSAVNSLLGRE